MIDLVLSALAQIPTVMREPAARVAVLTAEGYSVREAGAKLGITYPRVMELREELGSGMIRAMREDGYADVEIMRTLRVPTARVLGTKL